MDVPATQSTVTSEICNEVDERAPSLVCLSAQVRKRNSYGSSAYHRRGNAKPESYYRQWFGKI